MREITSKGKTVPCAAAVPSGADGLDMTQFSGAMRVDAWKLTVTISGGGATVVSLFGKDDDDVWGAVGDDDGKLNQGVALASGSSYHFFLRHLGVFTRLCGRQADTSGTPTVAMKLAEVIGKGD